MASRSPGDCAEAAAIESRNGLQSLHEPFGRRSDVALSAKREGAAPLLYLVTPICPVPLVESEVV